MARARHPIKAIEDVLRHAEACGWRIKVGGSHAWGKMYCPFNSELCRCQDHCATSIWSTPRNSFNHARNLQRVVDGCVMQRADADPLAASPKDPKE
ncbi:hypothetical protein CCU68_17325 [Pseudomonas gingeri NCPPB 3146 = LMG 5327]|uniref:Uncharacterized protein n=1 Tax=Pseudomonas gingeri NCPPB 3146 = LMG 5327 TaxID=707248 RepID=A0ABX4Y251_9PSED|nr:hypothetical protein [Pseudomonas gingeri]PNQ91282.1 hypothetical protein CCU68_17325 [Pseudomonas gingeri NCPPB 3146 = LMG 5327]